MMTRGLGIRATGRQLCVLALIVLWSPVTSFVAPCFQHTTSTGRYKTFGPPAMQAKDDGDDEVNFMRSILETSWDSGAMGRVPSDPTEAANEAYAAVLGCIEDGVDVFFVDLELPSYDITRGENIYDEVLATEYCIELSRCLKGKTCILVRDGSTLDAITRILDARERESQSSPTDIGIDVSAGNEKSDSVTDEESVDSFREMLMSSWEGIEDEESDALTSSNEDDEDKSPTTKPGEGGSSGASVEIQMQDEKPKQTSKRYRLASLFGSTKISDGVDMMQDVVNALRRNALPADDEENIIILSAINRQEMIAVRSLVAKYEGSKKVVLVNCRLEPLPRELAKAETAYSLVALSARAKGPGVSSGDDSPTEPRIVVLRRYPRDWQIFVDVGEGFNLARTYRVTQQTKRRLPMQIIAETVQKYLSKM